MNLYQTIRTIETVAAAQPDVRTIVREDVFRLNAYKDTQYGVFAWLQGEHRTDIDRGLIQYSFTFFYVDRLTDGARNELEVQSVGVETLDNILRTLADLGIIAAGEYGFRTFNERFSDECAGVYCSVVLLAEAGAYCAEASDGGMRGPDGWEQAAAERFYLHAVSMSVSREVSENGLLAAQETKNPKSIECAASRRER